MTRKPEWMAAPTRCGTASASNATPALKRADVAGTGFLASKADGKLINYSEGSWGGVFELNRWPIETGKPLAVIKDDFGRLTLSPDAQGLLTVHIEDFNTGSLITIQSKRLNVEVLGQIIVSITWQQLSGRIYLQGIDVTADEHASESVTVKANRAGDTDVSKWSLVDPGCDRACEAAVAHRTAFYLAGSGRTGRLPKSRERQRGELNDALFSLDEHVKLTQKGRREFIWPSLNTLRALLYEDPRANYGTRQYNPLLLRLAAQMEVGLPIYFKQIGGRAEHELLTLANIQKLELFFLSHTPTTRPSTSGMILADLQDWLNEPAVIDGSKRPYNDYEDFLSRGALSNSGLIHELASQHSSHYDEHYGLRPEIVIAVKGKLVEYITAVSLVVLELGSALLHEELPTIKVC
jgi:hypothetical protein